METHVPNATCQHKTLRIPTVCATEFFDLTEYLDQFVAEAGIRFGFVNVQSLHTTTAIVVNEKEPLLHADFASLLEKTAPQDAVYRHDDASVRTVNLTPNERVNGHAHCRALFLTTSACVNIVDGRLRLGQWQRIFLVELDGPREREISIMVVGESGR
jgi:secondary thiamine-phosphate synthase enzyme